MALAHDPSTGECLEGVPVVCDDGDACNGLSMYECHR